MGWGVGMPRSPSSSGGIETSEVARPSKQQAGPRELDPLDPSFQMSPRGSSHSICSVLRTSCVLSVVGMSCQPARTQAYPENDPVIFGECLFSVPSHGMANLNVYAIPVNNWTLAHFLALRSCKEPRPFVLS